MKYKMPRIEVVIAILDAVRYVLTVCSESHVALPENDE